MDKALAEKLENRKRLITIIQDKPGIHFRELQRESGFATGELEYHIDVLVKMEIISKKKSPHYTKYYPEAELGSKDKGIMDILRQPILRDILMFILSSKQVSHGEVTKEFRLLKSTASFYLNKLIDKNLIEKRKDGKKTFYKVNNPKEILRLILLYKKGFGEELASRAEGLWGNL